jgi:hypothetical protein
MPAQRTLLAGLLLIAFSLPATAQVDEDAVRAYVEGGLITFELDGHFVRELEFLPGGVLLQVNPDVQQGVLHPSVEYDGWRLEASDGDLQLVQRMSRNWEVHWDVEQIADSEYRFTTDADGRLAVLRASETRRHTNDDGLLGNWHLVSVDGVAQDEGSVFALDADGTAVLAGISVPELDASGGTLDGQWFHSARTWHARDDDGWSDDEAQIVMFVAHESAGRGLFIVRHLDDNRILMQPDRLPIMLEFERR